jgi:transposase-like protein
MMNETQPVLAMQLGACGVACQRLGKHRNGLRRFRCSVCGKTYTETHRRVLETMYVSQERAVMALQLLLEGNSIRSTERITGMDRNTIMSLLVKAGERCQVTETATKPDGKRDCHFPIVAAIVGLIVRFTEQYGRNLPCLRWSPARCWPLVSSKRSVARKR